jgi:hypothetical protein
LRTEQLLSFQIQNTHKQYQATQKSITLGSLQGPQKKQTKFYFIFPKGRRIVKKTKTHHVSQMPQAMQNMKTQMNAAAAAAQNLSLEINNSIRRQPKFHSKGPNSSSSSSWFPSLKCLSNSIL